VLRDSCTYVPRDSLVRCLDPGPLEREEEEEEVHHRDLRWLSLRGLSDLSIQRGTPLLKRVAVYARAGDSGLLLVAAMRMPRALMESSSSSSVNQFQPISSGGIPPPPPIVFRFELCMVAADLFGDCLRSAITGGRMRATRIVFGLLGLVLGALLIAGAIVGLSGDRDADDYFTSDSQRFERSSFAIVSQDFEVLTTPPSWVVDFLTNPLDVRLRGSSNAGTGLFIGVGPTEDVEAYLADVSYDTVDVIRFNGSDVDYSHHAGTSDPASPLAQAFWAASVDGEGLQSLEWSVEQGAWSFVVMNSDGSVGVDAGLGLSVRVSNFVVMAWVILVLGATLAVASLLLATRDTKKNRRESRAIAEINDRTDGEAGSGSGAALGERVAAAARSTKEGRQRIKEMKGDNQMGLSFFEWVNRRFVRIVVAVSVVAILLAAAGQFMASTEEPNGDPSGEIYVTADRASDVFAGFTTGVQGALFIVEGLDGDDVLTRDALLEWKTNSDSLRAATRDVLEHPLNSHLSSEFNTDFNAQVDGVYSIADAVDAELAGGLAGATNADVKLALAAVLAVDAPTSALRGTMSRLGTVTPGTVAGREIEVWEAPAFQALVLFDIDTFEVTTTSTDQDVIDDERLLDSERWLREVQTELQGTQDYMSALGLGIDFNLEFGEQADKAMPFVAAAVIVILLLVGVLLRSYWAAIYVTVGLTVTIMIYKGIFALIGLKGGLLLEFIVPISIISFGVDFFIHAIGRAREAQVEGHSRERAYPIGMSSVILALVLAALSSAAAFVSNAVSGIEMIVQFGIGAAIALLVAFAILGVLTPKLLLVTEDALGPHRVYRGPRWLAILGFLMSLVMSSFLISGAVGAPLIGAIVLVFFVPLFVYLPFLWTRRYNRRMAAEGRELETSIKGAGHGLPFVGAAVHFVARWRVVTFPLVVLLAVGGVWGAFQVKSDTDFTDFLSSESNAVRSIRLQEHHYGDLGVGSGYIYIEGDLTAPETLAAMGTALDEIRDSGVEFSRDFDDEVIIGDSAVTLVRFATASSVARGDVEAHSGVAITDSDGNGLPDSAEQVAAIYAAATSDGLRDDSGQVVFPAEGVRRFLHVDGDTQATRLEVIIGTFTDKPLIAAGQAALEDAAANLRTATSGVTIERIGVSGEPITNKDSGEAFTKSMLVSLPIALLLAFLIVALMLKSIKYAAVSVAPILLVVAWLYGFMYLADYTINLVTATIAAISIGIGVDFATHFTVRFREELAGEPSRHPALRRAGEGTGSALMLSALTSIAGFGVLGAAPMPIFAVYGVLTAVMIALAVVVSLLVLPSLLLFVTPSLKGEERERLEWERTRGEWVYEPHTRGTATQER